MNSRKTVLTLCCVGVLAALSAGCGDPTGPELPALDFVVAAGDGQFGAVGGTLPTPLHAVVYTRSSGNPREDVTVLWEVTSGDASFVTSAAAATDSTGSTYATVRLGATAGEVTIRVKAVEQETASASFTVHAVESPLLNELPTSQAAAGDTLTLTGLNFHPDPALNAVLFSGIRGTVVSAAASELQVVVPSCLPSRTVSVRVLLGTLASDARSLTVVGGAEPRTLAPGEVLDVSQPSAPGCLRLAGGLGTEYLVVPYSAALTATARHDAAFLGLASQSSLQRATSAVRVPPEGRRPAWDAQASWEASLRMREEVLVTGRGSRYPVVTAAPRRAEAPAVGDERSFKVLNGDGGFDDVVAVARFVGDQAVLYVDKEAPDGGFTTADLQAFSDRFDGTIHPTVAGAFGTASDLDGNERIVILFTPAVNRLTPRGSSGGYIGGFFYGLDLLRDENGNPVENSNDAEIFYALVPDPEGTFSDPRPKSQVLDVTPAILAHEFQHMIHFNQRILVGGAEGPEAPWLSEGLAQMAEDLVARTLEGEGDFTTAEDFRDGNEARARRYLSDPSAVSLLFTSGQGSLAERGGGWLHVLYLTERFGQGILTDLTRDTRKGVENVTFHTGERWDALLADWWAALYLDGRGSYAPELGFGSYGLRQRVQRSSGVDPLRVTEVGDQDFWHDLSFWSTSARHYILRPPSAGSLVVRLGGEGGGAASAGAELGLRIVRLF